MKCLRNVTILLLPSADNSSEVGFVKHSSVVFKCLRQPGSVFSKVRSL